MKPNPFRMRHFAFVLILLSIVSCAQQSKREQEFDSIKMGMVKSEVLEVAGNPHWSDRWEGHDRWIYYMKPEDRQTERVVYFKNGKVVLTGERIKPLLSADDVEEIKKPRAKTDEKEFKPSMSEDELRKEIKKEIEKKNKGEKEPKFESI